jgi:hypothetical protein
MSRRSTVVVAAASAWIVWLAVIGPGSAIGQALINSSMDPVPDSLMRRRLALEIGRTHRVRVVGPSGTFELWEPVVTPQGIAYERLASSPDSVTARLSPMPWSEVETIQTRMGSSKSGALIGAGIGALGGLVFGIQWSNTELFPGGEVQGDTGTAAVVGTLVGGAIGAVTGAVLGSAFGRWGTAYEYAP